MSDLGEVTLHPEALDLEKAVVQGGTSPKEMEQLVQVLFFGKSGDAEAVGESKDKGDEKSRQLTGDPFTSMARGEFVPPRYNPEIWAATLEQNTRLGRSIRTFARNTVGLGWFIEPIHKIAPETTDEEKKEIADQTRVLQKFFETPNDKMPTAQIFYLMKVDEEATGDGYIEVVRDNKGEICGLYHAPAITMRIRVRRDGGGQAVGGYVQIRGSEKRYFKEFGDKKVMNAKSGDYHEDGSLLEAEKRSSEILHFQIYSPTSSYYGAPRYVSAAPAIAGNRLASIRNTNFFENDAVPRGLISVSGGRLDPGSIQQVEDFFKAKTKGVENAHRVAVLQVEQQSVGFQNQGQGAKIEFHPLTVGVTEDASFQTYRNANDEEIRESFGIAKVFFTGDESNKASAQVSREITNEQEFEPDRLEKEYILNQTIVKDLLKGSGLRVRFRFERLKLTDPLDTARLDQMYASMGAMTPNELRESVGKPPYKADYKFADKPLQIAMAELSMGLAEAILGEGVKGAPGGVSQFNQVGPALGQSGGEQAGDPPDQEATGTEGSSPLSESSGSGEEAVSMTAGDETVGIQKERGRGPIFRLGPQQLEAMSIARELMADARRFASVKARIEEGVER